MLRPLILASTSRYRAALLERFGLRFNSASPAVDETDQPGETALARATRLSDAKAEAVATQYPEAVVIGGDQVAASGGTVLHKPGNAGRCREQLSLLSASTAEFHTACTVRCVASDLRLAHIDTTRVTFRALTDSEIARYVERERPGGNEGPFTATQPFPVTIDPARLLD